MKGRTIKSTALFVSNRLTVETNIEFPSPTIRMCMPIPVPNLSIGNKLVKAITFPVYTNGLLRANKNIANHTQKSGPPTVTENITMLVHPWYIPFAISRVLQAIGAISSTGCYIILVTRYSPENMKSKYYAISNALFLLAAGLGILIGALITEYLSWIIAMLLPLFTLAALPTFLKHMPDDRIGGGKLDIIGVIFVSSGIVCTILAITMQNIYLFVSAVVIVITYHYHAKNHKNPFL